MSASISGTGTLRIQTEGACEVFLDGESIASLQSGESTTLELLPDSYTLVAEQKSGASWKQTIQIQEDAQTQVTISFEKESTSPDPSSSSEPTIIRPGRDDEHESSGWSWFWIGLLLLGVGGIATYGLRPQWTRPVTEYAREVVGTFQTSDTYTTTEDTPTTIQISEGIDESGSVKLLEPPSHGSLKFASDSTEATYRPDLDFSGSDEFLYTIREDRRVDTIQASIKVESVIDAPRALNDSVLTEAGSSISVAPLKNDRSPDTDGLHLEQVDSASKGTLTINSDSTQLTYTPQNGFTGTDRIGYVIADTRGATDSAVVSIFVEAPPPTPSDLDIEWQRISAGSFVMGSDRGTEDTQPSHQVEITTPFRMSAHEVTVRQFRLFVEATGYTTDAERLGGAWRAKSSDSLRTPGLTWRNPGFEQAPDHPVVCVSWNDAKAFADWIGGRLPTEAEWEYAARAGVTYPKLPGKWKRTTWYAENADGRTHPVGQKEPNDWGLYDVQGNVWEWVQDWYAPNYYERSPMKDPRGPDSGELRVCRGGSWYNEVCWLPSRNRASPTYRANNIGFRVVKPVQNSPPR
jgi:formylglycine-generating enzyme required for sulfatase activity